jgi:hypothetical protein
MIRFGHGRQLLMMGGVLGLVAGGIAAVPAAVAATPSLTIQDPGTPTAGSVTLRGTAIVGTLTTTVLYAADVSTSTAHPEGLDCNGDGFPGGRNDDLNGDKSAGDVLDCEIAGIQQLNDTLAGSPAQSLAGLEHFNSTPDALVLAPGSATPHFVAPQTSSGGTNVVDGGAAGLQRTSARGTDFDGAVQTALDTVAEAPAGPKWVIFMSDGKGDELQAATKTRLSSSRVKVRTFQIGTNRCDAPMVHLAEDTGQSCTPVPDVARIAPDDLGPAQSDDVSAIRVTIGGRTFAGAPDIANGWHAVLTLGAGTYTAHVTAVLTSGSSVSADRSFTVAAGGAGAPPPGSVGGPALIAGSVSVQTPKPIFGALPRQVKGRVGTRSATGGQVSTATLNGATVLLQGKRGTAWHNVAHAIVTRGVYSLTWKGAVHVKRLRVVLLPFRNVTRAEHAVPRPGISSCRRTGSSSSWQVRCATIAANGHLVRLLRSGAVVQRTHVASGHLTVTGAGALSRYKIVVNASPGHRLQLHL